MEKVTKTRKTTKKATTTKKAKDKPQKEKRSVGRPMVFSSEKAINIMQDQISKYLEKNDKQELFFKAIPTSETTATIKGNVNFITLGEVALMCGVSEDTLANHAKAVNEDGTPKNPELAECYEMYKSFCKMLIEKGALCGSYQSNVATFLLSANYGLTPKSALETENNTKLEVQGMDELYKALDNVYDENLQRLENQKEAMLVRKQELDELGNE